jgi:hypothetical protein
MAMNTPSLSFGTNIKSSFTFPARPPPTQQVEEQQQCTSWTFDYIAFSS